MRARRTIFDGKSDQSDTCLSGLDFMDAWHFAFCKMMTSALSFTETETDCILFSIKFEFIWNLIGAQKNEVRHAFYYAGAFSAWNVSN